MFKVSAGGSVSPKSGIYTLWTELGGLNENLADAVTISSPTSFKSSIIDQWTSYYIRAVNATFVIYSDLCANCTITEIFAVYLDMFGVHDLTILHSNCNVTLLITRDT